MVAQKYQTWVLTAKEIINVMVSQGLWIAVMTNMAAISGRVRVDGFIGKQRKQLIKVMNVLTAEDLIKGPVFGVVKVPNPGFYVLGWLRPLKGELEKTEFGSVTIDGQVGEIIPG
jgi:hypothetical protein